MTDAGPRPDQYRSPSDLKAEIEASRDGDPFLVLIKADTEETIVSLAPAIERLSVGRSSDADIDLDSDNEVSRLHAELVRVGRAWTISDEGLSKNGTFVNERQISGRHRLLDGDVVRLGRSSIRFCDPLHREPAAETAPSSAGAPVEISDAQRRVLLALCRPFAEGSNYASPASNDEIAAELVISVDAVKSQMRQLFKVFAVDELPRYRKRAALAELVVRRGVISPREFRES